MQRKTIIIKLPLNVLMLTTQKFNKTDIGFMIYFSIRGKLSVIR